MWAIKVCAAPKGSRFSHFGRKQIIVFVLYGRYSGLMVSARSHLHIEQSFCDGLTSHFMLQEQ